MKQFFVIVLVLVVVLGHAQAASIFSGADGTLVALFPDDATLQREGLPASFAHRLDCDEHSNGALLKDIVQRWDAYRLTGTNLTANSSPVAIAPEAAATAKAAFKLLRNLAANYSVTINSPDEIRTKYDDLLAAINSAINTARSNQNAATLLAQYKSATDARQTACEDLARAASLYNLYQDRRSAGR